MTTHGNSKRGNRSAEYWTWARVKARCLNKKSSYYQNYGGRGISVCDRWLRFENFLENMGVKPSPECQIDRIDVNGNYEPSNCRWVTPQQNSQNRGVSSRSLLGYKGVSRSNSKFRALITLSKKSIYLGCFETILQAAIAYDDAAKRYFGDFATTNSSLGLLNKLEE